MISLDSSRLRELERILIKLVEVLSDLDIASEVISPLPLENYVSILQYLVKNLQEALSCKKLELMLIYSMKSLAVTAQLSERLLAISDIMRRLRLEERVPDGNN